MNAISTWLDITLSPLAYIILWVRRTWWQWAHNESMTLEPSGPHISEQLQAINDLDTRMRRIVARWKG